MLNLFFNSRKTVVSILPQLKELNFELQKIDALDNKIKAVVSLFQVISPLEDSGGFGDILEKLKRRHGNKTLISALEVLQTAISRTGRCRFGMNRTVKGQPVTGDNVFIGDVYGLWTKTANHWLSQKDWLQDKMCPDLSPNSEYPISEWTLLNNYCGQFVSDNVDIISKQIQIISEAC